MHASECSKAIGLKPKWCVWDVARAPACWASPVHQQLQGTAYLGCCTRTGLLGTGVLGVFIPSAVSRHGLSEAGLAACRNVCSISGDILGCCTRTGLLGRTSLTVSRHGLPEAGLAACEQTITCSLESPARKEKELLTNS